MIFSYEKRKLQAVLHRVTCTIKPYTLMAPRDGGRVSDARRQDTKRPATRDMQLIGSDVLISRSVWRGVAIRD